MSSLSTFIGSGGGSGGSGGGGGYTRICYVTGSGTVNPETDFGLSDGDTMGYVLVGGGRGGSGGSLNIGRRGGTGGSYHEGTLTVNTAATDITVTIGAGGNGGSTNGNNVAGGAGGGNTNISGAGIDGQKCSNAEGLYNVASGGYLNSSNGVHVHGQTTPSGFGRGGASTGAGVSSHTCVRGQGGFHNNSNTNPKTGGAGTGGIAIFYY